MASMTSSRQPPSRGQGRRKRTLPEPRQYTEADLERAQERVEAAERRIANNHTSNPNRARGGLKRAQLALHIIESQLRLRRSSGGSGSSGREIPSVAPNSDFAGWGRALAHE